MSKLTDALSQIAPALATTLGGPLAGMAWNVLAPVFGLDPAKAQTPEGQEQLTKAVLGMSPETAAAVRKADQDYQLALKKLDLDWEKMALDDRTGARNMQIQTKDWTPRLIAAGVVVGFFTLITLMAFKELPVSNHDALMMLLGALSAAFTAVMAFYFGSSSGSQAKDQTIRDLSK